MLIDQFHAFQKIHGSDYNEWNNEKLFEEIVCCQGDFVMCEVNIGMIVTDRKGG